MNGSTGAIVQCVSFCLEAGVVNSAGKFGLRLGAVVLLAVGFSACFGPSDADDPTVKLQAQGTLNVTGPDGSGWRGVAVLLVRYGARGAVTFEIKDARYGVSYLMGELSSTLANGRREFSELHPEFDAQGVVVNRHESIQVDVTRVRRAAMGAVSLNAARLTGRLSSVGNRWANYRLGMLRTGRSSRIEMVLGDGRSGGISFSGETSAAADRDAIVESYALGTSGTADLHHTGWNTSVLLGSRVRFMMDLPEGVGSVWRSDSPVGWREEFPFTLAHPEHGTLGVIEQDFRVIHRGEMGRVELHDALEARLVVADHPILMPAFAPGLSPTTLDVSGVGRLYYELTIGFQANQIAVTGHRRFSVAVEHRDDASTSESETGTTRADLARSPVEWPMIEW